MNRVEQEIAKLLDKYRQAQDSAGEILVKAILDKLAAGKKLMQAVSEALAETGYSATTQKNVLDSVYYAACLGYGVVPKMNVNAEAGVKRVLLSESWTADKMNLSERLHGLDGTMRDTIVKTIQQALNMQASLNELSMEIFDGYKSGKWTIRQADLPRYMQRLADAGRRVANGDAAAYREYQKALAVAEKHMSAFIDRNAAGAPNKELMTAYKQLVDEIKLAVSNLNAQGLDKAAWVAVQEKSRFYADRIARTETARAWFDGFLEKELNNPLVAGFRWVLSSRHRYCPFDQCDVCANMNIGYGAGVYSKDLLPFIPRHPHCLCMIEPVYIGEADFTKKPNMKGARKYLDTLDDEKLVALFGEYGAQAYRGGADWQKFLIGWNGLETPKSRLTGLFAES